MVPPQAGDVITQVESVDEQWIVGFAGGKRGIVPKSFISIPGQLAGRAELLN